MNEDGSVHSLTQPGSNANGVTGLGRIPIWRELAVLAILGMELSWLSLWFRIFTQTGLFVSYGRAFTVLGGIYCGSYLLARGLTLIRTQVSLRRGVLSGWLAASLLFGLKSLFFIHQPLSLMDLLTSPVRAFADGDIGFAAEFMVMASVLWAWWRGMILAGASIGPVAVRTKFLAGTLALIGYGLLAPLTGEAPVAPLILFLFFTLLAMSTARVHRISRLSGGQRVPFDRRWLVGVLGSACGLVALAMAAVLLIQWKLADIIVILAVWLWRLVFLAGMTLLAPVLLVLMAVVPPLAKFLQEPVLQVIAVLSDFIQDVQALAARLGQGIDGLLAGLSLRLGIDLTALKPLLLWGILLLGFLAALGALGVLPRLIVPITSDTSERLHRPGGIRGLLARARELAGAAVLRRAARRLAAARIRRIYADLLRLCDRLGKPRPAAQTPLEFMPQMLELFPHRRGELEGITRAYLSIRYGEIPESLEEVQRVEAAWQAIRAEGDGRLKPRRRPASL